MDYPERTISIKEAQALVGVSRRTIYNWLESGKLRFKRTAGGSVRIYPDSLWREDGNSADVRSLRNSA